ncbi:sugar phosphate isomerase/epimerase family protein [Paenibacillus piri]|uniref:Sugar phosphate isomerase/epimerase n=1 Tax=Paenibacillus piri TaxID=2547395 RepID=A0A4R5KFX3_9BACL|nr:sugar phosphate isomerase/epimerase family protein [Paenibacillus piri]TDF93207.1 sugar phosphate isomerase/epimerase [Paenibacillus piri]
MAFGTLAHKAGKLPLRQLTQQLSELDIDFVQLAMSKAIGDIDTSLGRLSPGLANHIAEAFHQQGIRIGALGCYINPVHPDPVQRKAEIARFKEHLRFARDFGTTIVATETGDLTTYLPQDAERYEEIGWSIFRSTVEELAEEAEKWGVYVGLEPVCTHTLTSPQKMKRIMEEVPSGHIGVVLDPCNLFIRGNFERRDQVVDECFELFADRIVLAHLKDVTPSFRERDGRPQSAKPGTGVFDIAGFLRKLQVHKPFLDVSIEDTDAHEMNDVIHYLKNITAKQQ